MNTNLQVFQFENSSIRTVELEGVVWFIAKDVCDALAIVNSRDALKRLDEDERGVVTTDTLGGQQEMAAVNESGLYSLILTSRKPEAKRFKKWVTSEVLPSIRKTGQYQVSQMQPLALTQHDLATRLLKNELEVWTLFECPLHIAQQEIVKLVRKDTGVDFSAALKYAKAQQNILQHEIMLEPTELGVRLGLNARQTNRVLEDLGLQSRINGQWLPTERGEKVCQRHAWSKGSKSGYNLKWNLKAVEELLEE